jgi:hypothetical protein
LFDIIIMKLNTLALALSVGGAYGFPGMKNLMVELMKRQGGPPGGGGPPVVPEPLIGDLATKGATTPVGVAVEGCINGTSTCENNDPKVQ